MTERGADWLPVGFSERVGAALLAPTRALQAADHGQAKTGGDLAILILASTVATQLPEILSAAWIGYAEGAGVGTAALLGLLSAAVANEVTFLVMATLALTLAAGSRRSLGRDFDLTCVAVVPLVTVELLAGVGFAAAGASPQGMAAGAVGILAYGWAAVVLFFAWRQARARPSKGER